MRAKALIALAAAPLAFGTVAQAAADKPDRFTLNMTISDNGEIVAKPQVVAVEGETAYIEIRGEDGRSYRAQFVITASENGLLTTRSHWKATSPTLGTIAFSPVLKVMPGEAARIVRGQESKKVQPLHVTYTVRPVAG